MRVLTRDAVADIKAAKGHFRAAEVARATGVHRSTITRIWAGEWHRDVEPASEVPSIQGKTLPRDYVEDVRILVCERKKSIREAAEILGLPIAAVNECRGVFL